MDDRGVGRRDNDNLRSVRPSNNKAPKEPGNQLGKGITVNIELDGYEAMKMQLNDLECQMDRIIDKQKQIVKYPGS